VWVLSPGLVVLAVCSATVAVHFHSKVTFKNTAIQGALGEGECCHLICELLLSETLVHSEI
jgi:hypothetical protein